MKFAGCCISLLLSIMLQCAVARANEVNAVRSELKKLRMDYETRIKALVLKIESLSGAQQKSTAVKELVREKHPIGVEYVGRKEGPFEKGGLVVRESSGFGRVSVGGYMDQEFESFEGEIASFDQHRWILNVGAELGDRLRFYSEYEIEHGGPDASGGGEANVEQAWLDYVIADLINFRAGALLVPFGRYNLYHDSDLQDLTARPIVARDIIPTTWTEAGAGVWGEINPILGDYDGLDLGYEVYVINGLNGGFSDTGMRGARGSIGADNNKSFSIVGRGTVSPLIGHEIGISGYYGEYDTAGHYISGFAVDWFHTLKVPVVLSGLSLGPLEIAGEFAYFDLDNAIGPAAPGYMTGYYAQGNLHFWPDFLNATFLGSPFEDPAFTLVCRYGWAKIPDDADAPTEGPNIEDRITLGLNYRPVESWVFKLEYQINRGKTEALEKGDHNGFMASAAMGF